MKTKAKTNSAVEQRPPEMLLREFATSLVDNIADRQTLMEAALGSCCRLLAAHRCSIWLFDEQKNQLVLKAAVGYVGLTKQKNEPANLTYPVSATGRNQRLGITAYIYKYKASVIAQSYAELARHPHHKGAFDPELHSVSKSSDIKAEDHPCQQFYGGPIMLGNRCIGVLKVENKTQSDASGKYAFSETDKFFLHTVATLLALALKQAEFAELLVLNYRFMLHATRNELVGISCAQNAVQRMATELQEVHAVSKEDVEDTAHYLRRSMNGFAFYLENMRHFLDAKFKFEEINIAQMCAEEVKQIREAPATKLAIKLELKNEPIPIICGDKRFLRALIKEVLQNAESAIVRRSFKDEEYIGSIRVVLHHRKQQAKATRSFVEIEVLDDGKATVDETARHDFKFAWEIAWNRKAPRSLLDFGRAEHLGLPFMSWVIREHSGTASLALDERQTRLRIKLPLHQQSKKESNI